jgi:hypothetical protein
MSDIVFILRTINDNDGTVNIEAFSNQAVAEAEARQAMDGMDIQDKVKADHWERWEGEGAVGWNPPPDSRLSSNECVVWKVPLDGSVVIGERIYAIWTCVYTGNEMGIQEAFKTEDAANEAAERAMERIGGNFECGGDTDGVTWIDRDNQNEVFIWALPVIETVPDGTANYHDIAP